MSQSWRLSLLLAVPLFIVLAITSGFLIAILATVTLVLAKEQLGRDLARKRAASGQSASEHEGS